MKLAIYIYIYIYIYFVLELILCRFLCTFFTVILCDDDFKVFFALKKKKKNLYGSPTKDN